MILITSAAFVSDEFFAEVGPMPPSFLPIGNRRLYKHQVSFLRNEVSSTQEIFISLPDDYTIPESDLKWLIENGITVIKVPSNFTLNQCILFSWTSAGANSSNLTILHGDTLFKDLEKTKPNSISVHVDSGHFPRDKFSELLELTPSKAVADTSDGEKVISGLFRIDNVKAFMKCLLQDNDSFLKALYCYHRMNPLITIEGGKWYDFGHLNSFYESRSAITTERSFNCLRISDGTVSKYSNSNPTKIQAELYWYHSIPANLRMYVPNILTDYTIDGEKQIDEYSLEYLHHLPLNDVYVFTNIDTAYWRRIFKSLRKMLSAFETNTNKNFTNAELHEFNSLIFDKTFERIELFERETRRERHNLQKTYNLDFDGSLIDLAKLLADYVKPATNANICISHGDLCFSNILFDARSNKIKCLDPRGALNNGEFSIFGDRRYDIAKLYHSVIGLYDFIICGDLKYDRSHPEEFRSTAIRIANEKNDIQRLFREELLQSLNISEVEIAAMTGLLFIAMLPLHSENTPRQETFIANALRMLNLIYEMQK